MKVMAMLVVVCCVFATLTTGSGPITVGETRITNDYPETVAFEVEATSTAATITSVEFDLTIRGESSTLVEPAEFTSAQQVVARFAWKTRRDGIPPGTPIQYNKWTVRDDSGNTCPHP